MNEILPKQSLHTVFGAFVCTLSSLSRERNIYRRQVSRSDRGGRRGLTVWEPCPISKNRKCNLRKMGKREKKSSENTQTTREPRQTFACVRRLTLLHASVSPCCFVVVIAIPSQMLLFIQRGAVKMSLFYHRTMCHCHALPRRTKKNNLEMRTAASQECQ